MFQVFFTSITHNKMNRFRVLGLTAITQQARTGFFRQQSRTLFPAATVGILQRAYNTNTQHFPQTLNGWACFGKGEALKKAEFPLTQFGDDSVDMDIICCGICGTDIHCIDSGWAPTNYPAVMGHEIIGRVTRVGKNVKHLKVGDRAGVGCQCGSCHQCTNCRDHKENLCEDHAIWTFNDHWPNGDTTYGGFSDRWRGNKDFAFKIPDALSSVDASSILCGGVTTLAPMKRFGVGKGSKVAVLGLGGLGHFG